MSETRRRQRRTPAWRRFLRAWRWWAPLLAIVGLGGGGYVVMTQDLTAYSPPRLAGMPLVTARNENAVVVFLTSHQEVRRSRLDSLLGRPAEPPVLHWDLWAFDAKDLRLRWMTRLASVRRGRHDPDRGVVGAEAGVIWVLANRLVAVNQSGGRLVGDAAMIEARNVQLRGRFPATRQAFRFDRGLIVTAANGALLRVDPRGMSARPAEATGRATDSMMPLGLAGPAQPLKRRGIVDGSAWLGVMTAEELAQPGSRPVLAEPNFTLGRPFFLSQARVTEERNPAGAATVMLSGAAALRGATELRDGGLLALDNQLGTSAPVVLRSPVRLFLLHGAAGSAGEVLSCIGNDGNKFWEAPLGMLSVATGTLLDGGLPSTWALLLAGRAGGPGRTDDAINRIARIAARDGTVSAIDIAALPVAGVRVEAER